MNWAWVASNVFVYLQFNKITLLKCNLNQLMILLFQQRPALTRTWTIQDQTWGSWPTFQAHFNASVSAS